MAPSNYIKHVLTTALMLAYLIVLVREMRSYDPVKFKNMNIHLD